jgi:hypothetical protein
MNYDQFRTVWHEALVEAGLMPLPPRPSEAIDLEWFSRTYKITANLGGTQRAAPFYVTATLAWHWEAILAARSATTEEDFLMQVLDRDSYDLDTAQPWLRIDVTLRATLPLDSPLPLPKTSAWRRWVGEVTARLDPILLIEVRDVGDGLVAALSWRGEPEAQLHCASDGRLSLTRVELSAWQGINLPRQWDNPDQLPDPEPDGQLIDFAARVHQALQAWERCLPYLQTPLAA